MNNSVNLYSPNFGMAYKVNDLKVASNFLNSQEPKVIEKLTTEMKAAAERLKDSKYVDVYFYPYAKALSHQVVWRTPRFSEEGKVEDHFIQCEKGNVQEAVNFAIEKEKEMAAAYEYIQAQSNLLQELKA